MKVLGQPIFFHYLDVFFIKRYIHIEEYATVYAFHNWGVHYQSIASKCTKIEYNLRKKYREIRKKSALIRAWQV